MVYPGNPELSVQAQERVMTAFRQVVSKLQEGQREEALIGLEFVLRLDPTFSPAQDLQQQLASGASEIDLTAVISQLQAPTTQAVNDSLIEAVDDFNRREFSAAKEKVEEVLLDLPGHQEARTLLVQIEEALKVEAQVGQFLGQARQALEQGDPQEAANFVMMAQALDPHHEGISATLAQIEGGGGLPGPDGATFEAAASAGEAGETFSFDTIHEGAPSFTDSGGSGDLFGESSASSPFDLSPGEETGYSGDGHGGPSEYGQPQETLGGDVSDLFQADMGEVQPVEPPSGASYSSDQPPSISELMQRGDAAADANHLAAAIDAWSRIFLVDPGNEEAALRTEQTRHAWTDLEFRLNRIIAEAEEAHLSGDIERAETFITNALDLCPNHVGATIVKEQLESGIPPVKEPAPAMPDLEDDLFREDLPEEVLASEDAALSLSDLASLETPFHETPEKRRLPIRLVLSAATVVLVLAVGLWVGTKLLGSDGEEDQATIVNQLLENAELMHQQNRTEEAIHMLEEFRADEIYQDRIHRRLEKYRAAIAPPTPTPIPENISAAEDLLARGEWLTAYEEVMAGLRAHPKDPGLVEIRDRILEIEPEADALHNAVAQKNYRTAVGLCRDLLDEQDEPPGVAKLYDRCLFNAAMAELRAYNLTGAETFLGELKKRRPDDEEISRILAFIANYKARPVDMQLQIFIRSIAER